MSNKMKITRIAVISITVLVLVIIILFTRMASEQNGTSSNLISRKIVNYIMNTLLNNNIPINREDFFWRVTANILVRKAAHFIEYMLIGLFLSAIFNFFTKRLWISVPGALMISFSLAYLDEYRQQFVEGRESTWFDVKIDTYGSITGILITTIFFLLYNKFLKLKSEIRELKEELEKKNEFGETI